MSEEVKIQEQEAAAEPSDQKEQLSDQKGVSLKSRKARTQKTTKPPSDDATSVHLDDGTATEEERPFDLDVALREDSFQERGDEVLFADDTPVPAKEGKKVSKKGKKKKIKRDIRHGRAYIKASYNNTLVTITDAQGGVVGWSSAGQMGFKGPKKATPYAAGVVVKSVMQKVAEYNLKEVAVFLCGVGQGREAALRALNAQGMKISSIKDVTPIPHNGCRPSKPRRV